LDGIIAGMPQDRKISLGAIILAAGRSSRMGRPKSLLPWGETTVLGHLIALWTHLSAAQIAVVCAPTDAPMHAELNRLAFPVQNRIVNPNPDRGMFSSIQCATQWSGWKPALTHWAIVLGDQPHLHSATLSALAAAAARHPEKICQPTHQGHPRHPVWLPEAVFRKLEVSTGENLKQFLQPLSDAIKLVELNDPGLDLDIDHPEDYQKALQLSFGT
jgi:molybdenum cofactor cytidylyltransferase